MNRRFFVMSVMTAILYAGVFVSCNKDVEKLVETINADTNSKIEYDNQNRLSKLLWYDNETDVFKKASFTYEDGKNLPRIFDVVTVDYAEYASTGFKIGGKITYDPTTGGLHIKDFKVTSEMLREK